MPRGRKPRPTELKILAGAQPCRINAEAPQLAAARPEPPEHLDDLARAAWAQLCEHLSALRVLTLADAAALEIYCTVYSRWRAALDSLARLGPTIDTTVIRLPDPDGGKDRLIPNPKGCVKSNPAIGVASTCEATMARLLASFGLTPADRSRVKALDAGPTSKLAKFATRKA